MESSKESGENETDDETDLDPRIQIELEQLNSSTDEINKLEIQLDEANTTFRILLNDSTKRLKQCARKVGGSIERARPYYEALEIAKRAQQDCQLAAIKFQRANEIHQAAKETVALAETRFLSKQHEWEFDNAWQEMLNHATIKVTEAENQKAESGREHQKRATLFNAAEQKVQILEQRLKRSICKSRPYFEEKDVCQTKLDAQKLYINQLLDLISKAKSKYSASLRRLEQISEEIHLRRKDKSRSASPRGPREPGVGAELEVVMPIETSMKHVSKSCFSQSPSSSSLSGNVRSAEKFDEKLGACGGLPKCNVNNSFVSDDTTPHSYESGDNNQINNTPSYYNQHYLNPSTPSMIDCDYDLDTCDIRSLGSVSRATSSAMSEGDDLDDIDQLDEDFGVEELRQKVRELAVKGDTQNDGWENELTATINKLDNALLMKECEQELRESVSSSSSSNSKVIYNSSSNNVITNELSRHNVSSRISNSDSSIDNNDKDFNK